MPHEFIQVDAFASEPLYGNPAAVIFDADDLDTKTMQKIAQETNLSETVFFIKPTDANADYKIRIFTPGSELPFAGHPTVAAAHSIVNRFPQKFGNSTLIKQECGIGIVPIEIEVQQETGHKIYRINPGQSKFTPVNNLKTETVAKMLGCSVDDINTDTPFEIVTTGPEWLIVQIKTLSAMNNLNPNYSFMADICREIGSIGVSPFNDMANDSSTPVRTHVRAFAPGESLLEDPVTGSANLSICSYIAKYINPNELEGSYQSEQGTEIGRHGELFASWQRDGEKINVKVAGKAVTILSGQLFV